MLKLIAYPGMVAVFENWSWPSWAMYIIGMIEMLLAITIFYKPSRSIAAKAGCILMIGAISMHAFHKEDNQIYGPVIVLFLLVSLIFADDII